jgi:molybdopterin/thiamine biosynthesis adenylyltransferase
MELERLRDPEPGDRSSFRPSIFDLRRAEHRAEVDRLLRSAAAILVQDTLVDQLGELIASSAPEQKLAGEALRSLVAERLARAGDPLEYGRWVHYPWSRRIIHLLPPDELRELRTDRNRHKILREEQRALSARRIGIAGLSVGNSAALMLALEGIGGAFRLADFDTLSLSNMNRIRARTADLGLNKAVLCARQMFEIDPYLEIEIFDRGLDDESLERFLAGDQSPLDLVIEECDDLYMKLRIRERAKALRMPVLMDTSDGGLLDIERFDLEPTRAPFHGLVGDVSADRVRVASTKEKIPLVLAILGSARISTPLRASLVEIGETISTWPQLASSVGLGGALVADAARRILLGELRCSGRFALDLETLVHEDARVPLAPREKPRAAASAPVHEIALPPASAELASDHARFLLEHAVLAPSGGNMQPWRFRWSGARLSCFIDEARSRGALNFEHLASACALGAAVENIAIAARAIGFEAGVAVFPRREQPLCAAELSFSPCAREESPLFHAIATRATNRRLGRARALAREEETALVRAAAGEECALELITDRARIAALAAVLGEVDRIRFLSPSLHRELVAELRLTPEEAVETADGIDVATLELADADRAILELLSMPSTTAHLVRFGGGRAIARATANDLLAASALAIVSAPERTPAGWFLGGRAMQRVWLTATVLGLAVRPHAVAPYLFERLARGHPFADGAAEALRPLAAEFDALVPAPGRARVMLFKLSEAEPPTSRALRRPIDRVVDPPR